MKSLLLLFFLMPGIVLGRQHNGIAMQKKMQVFLEKYNTSVNTDMPKVYKGQLAGYATGGGITTRNQVFNQRPVTVTPPSYSAGCGGIDINLGGFSFIEGEELVEALKNITTSAASYAFLLAMKTISAQTAGTMFDLHGLSTFINMRNINSCEIGQQLAGSVWPKNIGASQHICQTIGAEQGWFSSHARERHECANQTNSESDNERYGATLGDALVGPYNLTWEILKKDPYLSTQPEYAEIIMSLTGTIIVDKDESPAWYHAKAENASFISALMYGGNADGYRCSYNETENENEEFFKELFNNTSCLELDENAQFNFDKEKSWYESVRLKLEAIQKKMFTDEELSEDEQELIVKSNLPILRTIAAMSVYHRGCSPVDISRMSKLIAIDVLCQFIQEVIKNVRSTAHTMKKVQFYDDNLRDFLENLDRVEGYITRFEDKGKELFNEHYQIEKLLDMIEGKIQQEIGL